MEVGELPQFACAALPCCVSQVNKLWVAHNSNCYKI